MNNKTYGYVRVSTRDQNEARQLLAMKEFGVPESCIFMDKQSGKDFNRPQYAIIRKGVKRQYTGIDCDDCFFYKILITLSYYEDKCHGKEINCCVGHHLHHSSVVDNPVC